MAGKRLPAPTHRAAKPSPKGARAAGIEPAKAKAKEPLKVPAKNNAGLGKSPAASHAVIPVDKKTGLPKAPLLKSPPAVKREREDDGKDPEYAAAKAKWRRSMPNARDPRTKESSGTRSRGTKMPDEIAAATNQV